MTIVLADVGADIIMKAFFNNAWADFTAGKHLIVRLYESNTTPDDGDTVATYTEATGAGYDQQTLSNGSWTASNSGGIQQVLYNAEIVFTFTAASNSIYGYYITSDAAVEGNQKLIYAERFSGAPLVIANNGDQIKFTPKFQLSAGVPLAGYPS